VCLSFVSPVDLNFLQIACSKLYLLYCVFLRWQSERAEECYEEFTVLFICDAVECGAEAEEGWETVQRTNKTKSRPSPTSGPASKASVPAARQADGDGRRTVSQLKRKEGNCRTNVTVSRQTCSTSTDAKKQHCSVSAVDVNGNSSNVTRSSPLNPAQQSKSSSHVGGSHGDRGARSSLRVMTVNGSCSDTVSSDTCLNAAEMLASCAVRESDHKLDESSMTGSGDRKLTAGSDDAVASRLHSSVCESQHSAVTPSDRSRPAIGSTDITLSHGVSCRTSSSMTEVRCRESTDVHGSSTDSERQSFSLCRKSVSDDTLVEHITVSGPYLIVNTFSVISCIAQ